MTEVAKTCFPGLKMSVKNKTFNLPKVTCLHHCLYLLTPFLYRQRLPTFSEHVPPYIYMKGNNFLHVSPTAIPC